MATFSSPSVEPETKNHPFFQEGLQLPNILAEENSGTVNTQNDDDSYSLEDRWKASCDEWEGKIMFPVLDGPFAKELETRNIVEFATCTEVKYKKRPPFYFPVDKYPVAGGYEGEGYKRLCKDLQIAALETGGFHLIKNGLTGMKGRNKRCKRFCCKRCRRYRGDKNYRSSEYFKMITSRDYRKAMKNVPGQKQSRRSATSLPLSLESKCNFFFLVDIDEFGFHVPHGRGRNIHKNHERLPGTKDNIPSRLLGKEDKQILVDFDSLQKILQNNFNCKYCGGCLVIEKEETNGSALHNLHVSCRRTKTCGKKYQTMNPREDKTKKADDNQTKENGGITNGESM